MEPSHIDKLLERYLVLLHEYSALRSTLETLQGGIYQNIARANFSGERGVRYGRDSYDDRMQASRRLEVKPPGGDGGAPEFRVVGGGVGLERRGKSGEEESEDGEEGSEGGEEESDDGEDGGKAEQGARAEGSESGEDDLVGSRAGSDAGGDANPISDRADEEREKSRERKERAGGNRDPLRWFGFGTPTSLRLAQDQAVQVVQAVAPRLASINAEMLAVEVEVRRARKRRAKAEAEAEAVAIAAAAEERVGRGARGESLGVEAA